MSYFNKRQQFLIFICLCCITVFAHAQLPVSVGLNQPLKPGETPEGISTSDWGSIQAQIRANMYTAYPTDNGGFNSSNPAHGWQIHYAADGTTTLSPRERDADAYHLGLKLSAIGYQTPDQSLESLPHPQHISSHNNTLDYHWTDSLTERWINSEKDLEQWFLLNQRPKGADNGQPLTLQLTLDSDLSATQNGNTIRFVNPSGSTTITYNKLKVWDVTGRQLLARMRLDAQQLNLMIDDSTARYPLTIDPSFQQQAYLKASNPGANDQFGISVAISGDTVVVGANTEDSGVNEIDGMQSDNSARNAGAVYVFTRSGSTWSQQAYLKGSRTDAGDGFGRSVAITGDTVVVGARGDDSTDTTVNGEGNNDTNDAGAAYVFTRTGSTWSEQAYLKASNSGANDEFGRSVAIAGDTVVVGAFRESSNATGVDGDQSNDSRSLSGAAYVFIRNDSTWSQQAYLKASNTDANDQFGIAVAITGDTVVIGASTESSNAIGVNGDESDNSADFSGAVYVFIRSGSIWSQQAYLKASNTEFGDQFGISVAIAGETVVVGAALESSSATGVNGDQNDNSADSAGAAFVFTRSGSTWSQQAYLKASNPEADDQFGSSVAIAGDSVVVGAFAEASNATGVDGDESDNSAESAGAAYTFIRNGSTWSQKTYLKASNTEAGDEFGRSVAIAGDTVVIGAFREDSNSIGIDGDQSDNTAAESGAAYVFTVPPLNILDIDGNGFVDALTDGLLTIRFMFGITGNALIDSAVANDCTRCTSTVIENYLGGLSSNSGVDTW